MEITFRFLHSFSRVLGPLAPVLLFLIVLIGGLGLFIGRKEGWKPLDSLYFAFVVATTIGFGDFCPTRPVTKTLSIVIALIGMLLTGILVAAGLFALEVAFERERHFPQ